MAPWHTWTCPYAKWTFIPAVDVSLFEGCYLSLVKVIFSFVLPFELVVTPPSLVWGTGWLNIFSVLFPGSLATTLDHPWPAPLCTCLSLTSPGNRLLSLVLSQVLH